MRDWSLVALDPRMVAYHEAGHAVAIHVLGIGSIREASILPGDDGRDAGGVSVIRDDWIGEFLQQPIPQPPVSPDPEQRERVWREMICALAGPVAVEIALNRGELSAPSPDIAALLPALNDMDIRRAGNLAQHLVGFQDTRAFMEEVRAATHEFLLERWPAIGALSDRLEAGKTIPGSEVRRLVDETLSNQAQQAPQDLGQAVPPSHGDPR
jgi:hypothetical protein